VEYEGKIYFTGKDPLEKKYLKILVAKTPFTQFKETVMKKRLS
jgi:hypothetical protein